jgi:hypothetical protein
MPVGGVVLGADAVDVLALTGVVAALVAAVIGIVVVRSAEWVQRLLASATHTIELDLGPAPELERLSWRVLYIRDGTEGAGELSEREKWFARLRNEIKPFVDAGEGPRKTAKVRFYRPLGFQFKCFVDVEDWAAAGSVQRLLEARGCEVTAVQRQDAGGTIVRLWFLHPDTQQGDKAGRYSVEETGGIKNNFFFPV